MARDVTALPDDGRDAESPGADDQLAQTSGPSGTSLPGRVGDLMQSAITAAQRASQWNDVPIGAAIFDADGTLLADGANERVLTTDPTAHAEIVAIRKAARRLGSWRLDGCILAVTLEPCAMCAGAIGQARVGTVIFGAFDAKAGAVASLFDVLRDPRLPHRPHVIGGIRADECTALLTEFFWTLTLVSAARGGCKRSR